MPCPHQVRHVVPTTNMDSSGPHNLYKSPRNVRIANLQNEGGPWIPCPHPGCVLSFTTPNGLRKHSRTGKHKFDPNPQPAPPSACLLQRYKPQLTMETPGKTPHIHKVFSSKKPTPLHSDSEGSDQESVVRDELSPLGFTPSASTTQPSPLHTLETLSPQQSSTAAGRR